MLAAASTRLDLAYMMLRWDKRRKEGISQGLGRIDDCDLR
jgi:hypothetical protein